MLNVLPNIYKSITAMFNQWVSTSVCSDTERSVLVSVSDLFRHREVCFGQCLF